MYETILITRLQKIGSNIKYLMYDTKILFNIFYGNTPKSFVENSTRQLLNYF